MATLFPVLLLAGRPAITRFAAAALLRGPRRQRGSTGRALGEDHLLCRGAAPVMFGLGKGRRGRRIWSGSPVFWAAGVEQQVVLRHPNHHAPRDRPVRVP